MLTAAGWWRDALPTGNGAIGAMPYGRVNKERILLNHERLWYRGVTNDLPDISDKLPELRQLMKDKKYLEANDLYYNTMKEKGYSADCASYHPAGDIFIEMPTEKAFKNYSRELDMKTACTSVQWHDGDIQYKRDCFVSRVNDTCVVRISASKANAVNALISLEPHDLLDAVMQNHENFTPPITFESEASGDKLHLTGKYTLENGIETDDGREFGISAKIITKGTSSLNDNAIKIDNADDVLILVKFFVYEESKSAFERIDDELDALPESFDILFNEHVKCHSELYNRTSFELETDTNNSSTEELLLKAYSGEAPLELVEKMANYGRYLLICSSRPGGLPSNLQGIWNGDYAPPWACFFMINENLQMNYWQSLPGQIPETLLGVVDFYTSYMDDFRENAKKLYGCNGIFIPSLMSPDTGLSTHTGSWIINWIGGAGWLAQHFYDYYLYTGDEKFLTERAIPFMLEIADFYEDFLYKNESGEYTVCPSISPENWPTEFTAPEYKSNTSMCARITYNATMDIAIIKEVLTNLINSSKELSINSERISIWQEIINNLPEYQINEDGAVREWLHPDFSDNYFHRHQSQLYPVFPGNEVSREESPELYKAFKVAVDKRLVIGLKDQTGWSLSHMANINARLGDGETAAECLDIMARSCIGKNFFTYHNDYREMGITNTNICGKSAPFQIDANMGWTAAVYEMLLFSAHGEIKLFPALPKRWRKGTINNLRARGQLNVSLQWDRAKNTYTAEIMAEKACKVNIHTPDNEIKEIIFEQNGTKFIKGSFIKVKVAKKEKIKDSELVMV